METFITAFTSATGAKLLEHRSNVALDGEDGLRQFDAQLCVRLPGGRECLLMVKSIKTAYPRDVRLLIHQLTARRAAVADVDQFLPFVVAKAISPGSRSLLRDAGINYYDDSGSLYFRHRTWHIDIERAPVEPERRRPGSLFAGAREQVVHALFTHWHATGGEGYLSGNETAALAAVSPYTVSFTLQELERQDWVETTGAGPTQRRRICNATKLLDAWAADWTRRRETVTRWFAYSSARHDPLALLASQMAKSLAGQGSWALTGAAAANALVPHLTVVDRATLIVPPGAGEVWAEELKLKPAAKGWNIAFVEREGASLMFTVDPSGKPGVRTASRFIQYLDLLDGVGRHKELAAEFRARALGC